MSLRAKSGVDPPILPLNRIPTLYPAVTTVLWYEMVTTLPKFTPIYALTVVLKTLLILTEFVNFWPFLRKYEC